MKLEFTKDQFVAFRTKFKALAHSRELTVVDMLLNNIVHGRRITYGFTPITNPSRLMNGARQYQEIWNAIWPIRTRARLGRMSVRYPGAFADDHIAFLLQFEQYLKQSEAA